MSILLLFNSSDITGTGALNSSAALIAGSGLSFSVGSGALVSSSSSISGAGLSLSTGNGTLNSSSSILAGVGTTSEIEAAKIIASMFASSGLRKRRYRGRR